jgi:hypothetical protein
MCSANVDVKEKIKKLRKSQKGSLIEDFTSGPSLMNCCTAVGV